MFLRCDVILVLIFFFTDQIHHQDETWLSHFVNKTVKNNRKWLKCG